MNNLKVVILAGGLGTRISEETELKPKPMVEVGGKPILWHIMKIYSSFGINDYIICCGYKGYVIKEYFANYYMHNSNVTFDMKHNEMQVHQNNSEPWKVTLVDTGEKTMTGGRLKRVKEYLENEEEFFFTYGDGVGDIDIGRLYRFHKESGALATLTATKPPGRFGVINIDKNNHVHSFKEKPIEDNSWINGGFFVLSPKVIDLVEGDETVWEREPLENLASTGRLASYKHGGFWHAMDTLRDRNYLEDLWQSDNPPWKIW